MPSNPGIEKQVPMGLLSPGTRRIANPSLAGGLALAQAIRSAVKPSNTGKPAPRLPNEVRQYFVDMCSCLISRRQTSINYYVRHAFLAFD